MHGTSSQAGKQKMIVSEKWGFINVGREDYQGGEKEICDGDGTDYSSQGPVGAEFARTGQSLDMW